jgi:sulfur-carrier protein
MRVKVRYFAALRERAGRDEEWVEVPVGTTCGGLYERLFPGLGLPVAHARNHEHAQASDALADGDEIVFLPPVGGG